MRPPTWADKELQIGSGEEGPSWRSSSADLHGPVHGLQLADSLRPPGRACLRWTDGGGADRSGQREHLSGMKLAAVFWVLRDIDYLKKPRLKSSAPSCRCFLVFLGINLTQDFGPT